MYIKVAACQTTLKFHSLVKLSLRAICFTKNAEHISSSITEMIRNHKDLTKIKMLVIRNNNATVIRRLFTTLLTI